MAEFNYKPFSDFYNVLDTPAPPDWVPMYDEEDVFAGTGPYEKQGLYSDVKHTLGASYGKDAVIDWASQFGIDTSGKFADVIGNTGILAATALQEIPDAWRTGKQAFKKGDYEALLSGAFLSQPWEDVLANLDALSIPYGLDTNEKLDYIPNLQKWKKMNQRATNQGIAQVAMQKQIQEAEAKQKATSTYTGPVTHSFDPKQDTGRRPDKPGGFTDPGKGSYGPWKAQGGLIDLYRYGGFI